MTKNSPKTQVEPHMDTNLDASDINPYWCVIFLGEMFENFDDEKKVSFGKKDTISLVCHKATNNQHILPIFTFES